MLEINKEDDKKGEAATAGDMEANGEETTTENLDPAKGKGKGVCGKRH